MTHRADTEERVRRPSLEDVVRLERHLAPAVREIDREVRHREARGVTPQLLKHHQLMKFLKTKIMFGIEGEGRSNLQSLSLK